MVSLNDKVTLALEDAVRELLCDDEAVAVAESDSESDMLSDSLIVRLWDAERLLDGLWLMLSVSDGDTLDDADTLSEEEMDAETVSEAEMDTD